MGNNPHRPEDPTRRPQQPVDGTPAKPSRYLSFTNTAPPVQAPDTPSQRPTGPRDGARPSNPGQGDDRHDGKNQPNYRPDSPRQPHPRPGNSNGPGPVAPRHPGDNAPTGYRPNGANHTIAYFPADKDDRNRRNWHRPTYVVPHGYTPPTYRLGHYYYPGPQAVKPRFYGYWSFTSYPNYTCRSVYFYYDVFPYIEMTRVIIEQAEPEIVYVEQPVYSDGAQYDADSRFAGLDDALADIRSAWIAERFDLIQRHVLAGRRIQVFLDGNYDYTISSDDYLSMTRDALEDMETVSFIWDKVREREDGQITAFGSHTYRANGAEHTVYISYTVMRVENKYYVTEVGSSAEPLDAEQEARQDGV